MGGPIRRFEVESCLGRGGFGDVYRATMVADSDSEVQVAVKVLRADLAAGNNSVKRPRDEARLLAQLEHPTFLRVYDLVVLDGRLALVTELVDGQDLCECWSGEAPLSGRGVLEVVERTPGVRGFAVLPKRWIVERTDLLALAQPPHG